MMKHKSMLISLLVVILLSLLTASGSQAQEPEGDISAQALGSAFTYQGRLTDGGNPANGEYDFQFRLYNANDDSDIGSPISKENVSVTEGTFTVQLDFGNVFDGTPFLLGISVRPGSSSGSYTTLNPRQPLTPAPYAHYAAHAPWSGLSGVPAGLADGDDNTTYTAGAGLTLNGGAFSLVASYRLPQGCTNGQIAEWNGSAWVCGADDTGSGDAFWSLSGNSGTTPGTHFVGTTDNQALEFKVNNTRALRVEYASDPFYGTSPNLIGGFGGNSVTTGVVGATIGGGGRNDDPNQVTGHYGTVGGGNSNTASDSYATVGGGRGNTASGSYSATVGGGSSNEASGVATTVGGGNSNTASGSYYATVSGGSANKASGYAATVGGGVFNTASGDYSSAAGRNAKANHDGTFVWADSTDAYFTSTGADQFLVRAGGGARLVKGASTFHQTYAALQVENASTDGEAAWLRLVNASNNRPVLKVLKHPDSNGNFIEGSTYDGTAETRKFHINPSGSFVAGSDFAEALPVAGDRAAYEPGDVLVISATRPGAVEKCRQPYDGAVIGVYSTRPGFLGADKDGVTEVGPAEIPVAIVGIVPVKVSAENGPIAPGDLLTTAATPGHAMKASPLSVEGVTFYPSGALIGKALEGLETGTGLIQMLVMLQ